MKTLLLQDCHSLSVYYLIRLGIFHSNTTIHLHSQQFNLRYTITTHVSEPEPFMHITMYTAAAQVQQTVKLHCTQSHLGNHKVWKMICPFTNTICCKLHFHEGYFKHRTAFKNAYFSQTISPGQRWVAQTIRDCVKAQKYLWIVRGKKYRPTYRGQPTRTLKIMERFYHRHAPSILRTRFQSDTDTHTDTHTPALHSISPHSERSDTHFLHD